MRTERPGQSALLLLDVVETLRRHEVEYLVIGAFALSIYGAVRASIDVDALLRTSTSTLATLRDEFERTGFTATLRQGDEQDPIPSLLIVQDGHGNRVDLLGGLRGLDPEAFARSREVPFLGTPLRFVGREDFIAMKCFAGGLQDLEDARSACHGTDYPLDLDLLRSVTRRFGRDAADRLERILADA